MTAHEALAAARAAGVDLHAADADLRFRAPRGALTPDLRAALVAAKPELLELLRAERKAEAEPTVRHVQPGGRDCPCGSRVYLDLADGARVCGRCGGEVAP